MNTRKRIMFWVWNGKPDKIFAYLEGPVGWTCCKIWGHEPVPDQCDKPEHDFCSWCMKSTPFQANKAVGD